MTEQLRFYTDLATWWPLLSPVEDYVDEAAEVARLLRTARAPVRTVLELGSGGGHVAAHLTSQFEMTLVDLSAAMLDVSRRHNPQCAHHLGDMRSVRLEQTFDAVLVHDAIDYMRTEDDLRSALRTAYLHCRPAGVVVLVPDHTTEAFEPSSDHGGCDASDGRGARYLEWSWDPDQSDTWIQTEYAFMLRQADGTVEVVHDTHRTGLFPRATWLEVVDGAGFDAAVVAERTADGRMPRDIFVGHRPVDGPVHDSYR